MHPALSSGGKTASHLANTGALPAPTRALFCRRRDTSPIAVCNSDVWLRRGSCTSSPSARLRRVVWAIPDSRMPGNPEQLVPANARAPRRRLRRISQWPRRGTSASELLRSGSHQAAIGVLSNMSWPCGQNFRPKSGCHRRRTRATRREARVSRFLTAGAGAVLLRTLPHRPGGRAPTLIDRAGF